MIPTPADKFTFGLWTVGNRGRDPFGEFVRPPLDPVTAVHRLAEHRRLGRELPRQRPGADRRQRRRTRSHRARLPHALDATGITGADGDDQPVHRPGLQGRRVHVARRRRPRATRCRRRCGRWISAWSSARAPTCSGADAKARKSTPPRIRSRRSSGSATRINFLCEYARDQSYELRFALEAKPNEPRGDIYFPTTASYLALHPHARPPGDGRRQSRSSRTSRWPG